MRRALPAVAAATLIGGSTALAFFTGGFFDREGIVAAVVAWSLVGLAALWATRPLPRSTPGRVALAGLALLCAWTAVSIGWAPVAGRAEDDLQRVLLYLGVFVAAMAFLRTPGARRWLEPSLALGVLIVMLYGLSERLLPGLIDLDRSVTSSGRLEQPLTYWNAMGLLAVVGILLAVRIAGGPERSRGLRTAAAAAAVPLGLAFYLTFSRGAVAALAVGVLVLVALAPAVRFQLRAIVAVAGATAVTCLVAGVLPSVKSVEEGQRGDTGEGLLMLAVLVLAGLAAAVMAARAPRRRLPAPRLPVSRPVTVLTTAILVVVAGGVAVALLEGTPANTSPAPGADPARFASIDTDRYRYWEVAFREFADQPLRGLGSGGFAVEWLQERDRVDRAGDAHSLYVETAAELGIIGLAFLAAFLGGVAVAVFRLQRRDAAATTGLTAVLAAWACHAGLDWDWEIPAATLPALLLAAAAVAWSEDASARSGLLGAELEGMNNGRPAEVAAGPSARNAPMRTSSRMAVLASLLVSAAAALALPAATMAQSAGDDQYVDPFQNLERGEEGGSGSQDGGAPQGGSNTQSEAPARSAPPADTEATTDPETVTSGDEATRGATSSDGPSLPSTGLPIAGALGLGLLLLGGGLALRSSA